MKLRLPLNWRTLYRLGVVALAIDLLLLVTPLIQGIGIQAQDRSISCFFGGVFLLPALYLFACGVVTLWECSTTGLRIRNLLGKTRMVSWESIQAVEQSADHVRLFVENGPPVIIPQAFVGYSEILFWLDRLSPATSPVLQPVTPRIQRATQTTFRLTTVAEAVLHTAIAAAILGVAFAIWKAMALDDRYFSEAVAAAVLVCLAGLIFDLGGKWVVERGELRIYRGLGPPRRYNLSSLRRICREIEPDILDARRSDWVLLFKDYAIAVGARREWSLDFVGALVREASDVEIIDYTQDEFATRYSVLLL